MYIYIYAYVYTYTYIFDYIYMYIYICVFYLRPQLAAQNGGLNPPFVEMFWKTVVRSKKMIDMCKVQMRPEKSEQSAWRGIQQVLCRKLSSKSISMPTPDGQFNPLIFCHRVFIELP